MLKPVLNVAICSSHFLLHELCEWDAQSAPVNGVVGLMGPLLARYLIFSGKGLQLD
jgi:hypothetical protein